MNYIIDFDVFEAAMLFAGDNDVRSYLNGVRLISNRVEATNGHVAYMAKASRSMELPEQIDGSLIYPDVIIKPKNKIPTKNRKNNFQYVSLTLGDIPRVDYLSFYGEILASDVVQVIDGKYPKLAKLFADHHKLKSKGEKFGMNAKYLALVEKALKRERYPIVEISPKSQTDSILVSIRRVHLSEVKEQILMMPVRL